MAAAVQSGSSRIQKVLQQAKTVFLSTRTQNVKDSGFAADLDRLKRLMGAVTDEDLKLSQSVVDQRWDYLPYVSDAPAACMEVFECPDFSLGIFMLKPHKAIPLHDHPGMHGIMKVLFGSLTLTSYSRCQEVEPGKAGEVFLVDQRKLTKASEPCCLYPEEGNIHEIQAESEPVAFLDILGPPYNPNEGRDCNYYIKADETSSSGGSSIFLKPGSNPSWFSCVPLKYNKPPLD